VLDLAVRLAEGVDQTLPRLLQEVSLETTGDELRDEMTVGAMSVSHCEEVSLGVLVGLDQVLVLVGLVGIVGVVALPSAMPPLYHPLLAFRSGRTRNLVALQRNQRVLLAPGPESQVLEDFLAPLKGVTLLGLQFCGLGFSLALLGSSVVTSRNGL
jgi:hypothetical protein